jgi:acetolactate synthase-1/2/3 large subunit
MGYELPVAIGSSFHKKRVFCIVGDGSFQFNIQELQTLKHNNSPVTVVVFNNSGYGAIKITQDTVFKRRYGTSLESDISFCNIEKVTKAYDIPYYRVKDDEDVGYLKTINGPIVVEVVCNEQERFPKVTNKPLPDGTFKNMPHEEMTPLLDDATLEEHMFVKRV